MKPLIDCRDTWPLKAWGFVMHLLWAKMVAMCYTIGWPVPETKCAYMTHMAQQIADWVQTVTFPEAHCMLAWWCVTCTLSTWYNNREVSHFTNLCIMAQTAVINSWSYNGIVMAPENDLGRLGWMCTTGSVPNMCSWLAFSLKMSSVCFRKVTLCCVSGSSKFVCISSRISGRLFFTQLPSE